MYIYMPDQGRTHRTWGAAAAIAQGAAAAAAGSPESDMRALGCDLL